MKTIIAETDFSENAKNALQYAGAFAAAINAKVILFNAFQLSVHASNTILSAQAVDEMFAAEKNRMDIAALSLSARYGITVDTYIKAGFVTEMFDEAVAELKPDLVIMGMHVNDWSDKLFGNTTTSIIRRAHYPILIIPEDATFNGIDKILYACDTNNGYPAERFLLLTTLAKAFNAKVQVFHVDTPAKKTAPKKYVLVTDVELALCEVEHSYKDIEDEHIVAGIERGVKEFEADLLVMAPHRLGFWEGVMNKSKTRMMALTTHLPLLVLPPPAG